MYAFFVRFAKSIPYIEYILASPSNYKHGLSVVIYFAL